MCQRYGEKTTFTSSIYISVSNYTSISTNCNTSTSGTPKSPEKNNPDKGTLSNPTVSDLCDIALTSGTSKKPETSNPDRSNLCQSLIATCTDHMFGAATSGLSHTLEKSNPNNSNQSKQSLIINYFTPLQLNSRTAPTSPQKSAYTLSPR
jgi:hypothetical protein